MQILHHQSRVVPMELSCKSARNALGLRYKLLPCLYTLMYEAHLTGAPVARPIFFSFPEFTPSYGLSTQFMLGPGIMISPVLKQGATSVKAMFPPSTWYNLFDMTKVVISKDASLITLDAPLNEVNVHVCQGTVRPMQRGGLSPMQRGGLISKEARQTPFTLVIAFPYGTDGAEALGKVYVDDDERPEMTLVEGEATYVEFTANVKGKTVTITSSVQMGTYSLSKGLMIEKMSVLGLQEKAKELAIEVDGMHLVNTSSVYFDHLGEVQGLVERGNNKGMLVEVGGLELPLGKSFSMS